MCTGVRYLVGFIGGDNFKRAWMKDHTETWERNLHTISKTSGKYPQESYAVMVHTIQLDWIFLQHSTKNMGEAFAGVKKMLCENFLIHLFFGK